MNSWVSLCLISGLLSLFWCYAWVGLRMRDGETFLEAPRRFAALDGLRGILAPSVFLHHAYCTRTWYSSGEWGGGNQVFLQAGWEAVTLFFFITGFLFWTKIMREPRLSFLGHLRSRLARLAPAYWAAIAVLFLIVAFRTEWRRQVAAGDLLHSLGDWVFFTLPGNGDVNGLKDTRNIIANVPWTLALEWIFYVLVPLAGWFAGSVFRTVLFLGLAYVALRLLMFEPLVPYLPERVRYIAIQSAYHLTRTFACGILVAVVLPRLQGSLGRSDFRRPIFSIVSLGGVLAVMLFADPVYAFRSSLPLVVPFALIVLGNAWFGLLTSPPTQFLGRISYSIYLLHGVALHLVFLGLNRISPVAAMSPLFYWLIIAALGAAVIGVANLWYRWFESPFISRKT